MGREKLTLENKSILVTGGAGFIGSHLVDRIIRDNPKGVVVVDNFFLGNEKNLKFAREHHAKIEVIRLDASNLAAMEAIVKEFDVDIVFDLATVPLPTSLKYPNWTISTIVGIASTLCELARSGLIESLIHFSTSETYGSAMYVPMDESHPYNASTPYAGSKSAADLIIQSYVKTFGIDATIVRPFNNFGPRQNPGSYAGIIPLVINRVRKGIPIDIFGNGDQTRDFSYVTETADIAVELYRNVDCHGDVWNVASGVETSINELVRMILNVMGKDAYPINFLPERPGDVRRHCADVSKTKAMLGLEASHITELQLQETISWYS
jgi:UDP-glucose 4-epimerase